MESNRCFFSGCVLDVEYACPCSSPHTYCCKLHIVVHLEILNKDHALKPIFVKPREEAREAVLKYIAKLDSKYKKQKDKVIASFSQSILEAEKDLGELMKEMNCYSAELNNLSRKISGAKRISKLEEDPALGLLSLQPEEAIKKIKTIIPPKSDWCKTSDEFFGFNEKIEKMIECYIENKFENYLDKRLMKIEDNIEEHDKSIGLANNELVNLKHAISSIIDENKRNWKEHEDWKESIKQKTEYDINLLNSQIISIAEDLNCKFKETVVEENQIRNIIAIEELRNKRYEIFSRPNNQETEEKFRMTCLAYEKYHSDYLSPLMQAYQDYTNAYNQNASIYNLSFKDDRTTLLIYNTETERKESKILEISEAMNHGTCIAQLPNGKLFCYGKLNQYSGITVIIDENFKVQALPSGIGCGSSSAIYFNNNIYCFGGWNGSRLTLSSKYDLASNQWVQLTPLPKADAPCYSIIFNGKILISGCINKNILRYSIDDNSFTTIPYEFPADERKILINAERLYLIEFRNGSIYESEIGSDSAWKRLTKTTIDFHPETVYSQYNKGGIYIGCISINNKYACYKFNLNEKTLTELK